MFIGKKKFVDLAIFCGYGWIDDGNSVTEILCDVLDLDLEDWKGREFKLFKKRCRKFKIKGLEFYLNSNNTIIIGRQFTSMMGDETRADLIRDVESNLFKLGGSAELPVDLICAFRYLKVRN